MNIRSVINHKLDHYCQVTGRKPRRILLHPSTLKKFAGDLATYKNRQIVYGDWHYHEIPIETDDTVPAGDVRITE